MKLRMRGFAQTLKLRAHTCTVKYWHIQGHIELTVLLLAVGRENLHSIIQLLGRPVHISSAHIIQAHSKMPSRIDV